MAIEGRPHRTPRPSDKVLKNKQLQEPTPPSTGKRAGGAISKPPKRRRLVLATQPTQPLPTNLLFQAALEVEVDDNRAAEEAAAKEEAAKEEAAEEEAAKDDDEVVEVIDDEVEEVEEVEEDLRDLLVLKYTSIFKVFLRKDEKGVVVRHFDSTTLAFTDARLFTIQKVPYSEFVVLRTKVSAYYTELVPKH